MTETTPRLTRDEQRMQTRTQILDAAESLFSTRGIASTSIEDITDLAGFSRGAFYSNFESKDALVTVLLKRRNLMNDKEMDDIQKMSTSPVEFFRRFREREEEVNRHALSLEFTLYALRNPEARPEVAQIIASSRLTTARLIEQQWAASGVENPPVDSTTAAKIIEALDDGLEMARLIEPDEFPLDMFVDTLILLQQALEALEEKNAASREQ